MRRIAFSFALACLAACSPYAHLRSNHPETWVELRSEHFVLRTDLPEDNARKAVADLETLRSAMLAAGWHGASSPPGRIGVVALQGDREMSEFLANQIAGVTTYDVFGDRMILADGAGDLLRSEVVKHELAHALAYEYLMTNPRWVQEGMACYLESIAVDTAKGEAVRGRPSQLRRKWLASSGARGIYWTTQVLGMGWTDSVDGYDFESLAWVLFHWMADNHPQELVDFLGRLSRGETMWSAFQGVFPSLGEAEMEVAMNDYLDHPEALRTARVAVTAWAGAVELRRIPAAEVYALRAQLFRANLDDRERYNQKHYQEEAAKALVLDPGNPLALALSDKPDVKLAVDRHPDDWRSWMLWVGDHASDVVAIRKAAELAPDNATVVAQLALAEQHAGETQAALQHAEQAVAMSPRYVNLDALAQVYARSGRCADALIQEERALDSLPDRINALVPAGLRGTLEGIAERCDGADLVFATPKVKACRQPLNAPQKDLKAARARFSVREDGSVTAVAIGGARGTWGNGQMRSFVQSCRFEPAPGVALRHVDVDIRELLPGDSRIEAVLKSCKPTYSGDVVLMVEASATFTIREDGTVEGVTIQDAPSAAASEVTRHYVQGCKFEPVVVDGKPQRAKFHVHMLDILTK
jgi:tetratricopeptide (TPR) repeat protein